MPLPILPHELFGSDCCGCLVETMIVPYRGARIEPERRFHCNECGAAVPVEDVQRAVLAMEATDVTCPHCSQVNRIEGFSDVFAFRCRHCGEGVETR